MADKPLFQRITAVFRNVPDAAAAYMWLHGHFDKNHILVLLPDRERDAFHASIKDNLNQSDLDSLPESEESGAAGVIIGAGLFALAGLALTGLGLLAAGPITAALGGGISGAMIGGLVGGLVGFGFPEASAHAYEKALKDGCIAIGVMIHDDQQVKLVSEQFQRLHGENIITI